MFNTKEYFKLLEDGKFQEAAEYRVSSTPEFIYKFVSLNDDDKTNTAKLASLRNRTIWFGIPGKQNDPFEFKGFFLDKKRLTDANYPSSLIDGMQNMMESGFTLASFTGRMENNLPMWANYANSHHGYCMKFRVLDKSRVLPVLYEPKRIPLSVIPAQFFNAWKKLQDGNGTLEERKEAKKQMDFSAMLMKENYFIKHESWKAEEEYRIICSSDNLTSANGKDVYERDVGLELVAVYTGIDCEKHDEIVSICSEISIPCYKCRLSDSDFSVFTLTKE